MRNKKDKTQIISSSTAEYFSKNLQQVGFSSPSKAVLTTVKEAVDNSLDACDDALILPEVCVHIEKIGQGLHKNADLILVRVEDNGPGLSIEDIPRVFGEYLASSKFGKGRCSRGQQGIGISAATTWAQLTSAKGVKVISKTPNMRKAISCYAEVDIKRNKGVIKNKEILEEWNKISGLTAEFIIEGRVQLHGEGGLLTYLNGITFVNPHLSLNYKILDEELVKIERITNTIPEIPEAINPHPHTMKLGEFIAYSHLFSRVKIKHWLKNSFSRVSEGTTKDFIEAGVKPDILNKTTDSINEEEFKELFQAIQNTKLLNPSTKSVLSIGEEAMEKSVDRMGKVNFFSVVTRKPTICDFKPIQVEVAIARIAHAKENDSQIQLLRFANRVPLQFDKSACAITKAVESVNWRAYGIDQPKGGLPQGPYVFAISVVSPFIKFKNASKETIDASDELVTEIRLTLIQAGQKLSRHIRREEKEADFLQKIKHIEQFGPILVDGICRIISASEKRKQNAEEGLLKILGKDEKSAFQELQDAENNVRRLLNGNEKKSEE